MIFIKMNDFPDNLRLLCQYKRSIAEVCRDLEINRSQWNKYLNGTSTPRPPIARKIADYFGFETDELFLDHQQFQKLLSIDHQKNSATRSEVLQKISNTIESQSTKNLSSLGGRSFLEYYRSLTNPGKILIAALVFEARENIITYRRIEFIQSPLTRRRIKFIYEGLALDSGERIQLYDSETLFKSENTVSFMYPDFSTSCKNYYGLKLGVTANHKKSISASRVFWSPIPKEWNLKKILRTCGLYDESDSKIDPAIVIATDNKNESPEVFSSYLDRPVDK